MPKQAVLVIDMVKDFADPAGKVSHKGAADIVPAIESLVRQARERGALPETALNVHVSLELVPPLEPASEDYVIYKRRYSAFVGTDLDLILRDNHVDTLFLAGTKTNVCIRATAQDAFESNYRVIVPHECVSTDKLHLHQANLEDIGKYMGRVVSLEEAIALLGDREDA